MQFAIAVSFVLSLLTVPAQSATASISYDRVYDNVNRPLATVACSDGTYGLLTRGYTTFSSLPRFPFIGGAEAVTGWNSPNCGTCYQLTYTNVTSGVNRSINVLAIDRAKPGFNVALEALEALLGPRAVDIGRTTVDAEQ
ncbi:hypothetical protein DXG03_008173, partial [Asterophora parasitica]